MLTRETPFLHQDGTLKRLVTRKHLRGYLKTFGGLSSERRRDDIRAESARIRDICESHSIQFAAEPDASAWTTVQAQTGEYSDNFGSIR